jgi:hypothetical protein
MKGPYSQNLPLHILAEQTVLLNNLLRHNKFVFLSDSPVVFLFSRCAFPKDNHRHLPTIDDTHQSNTPQASRFYSRCGVFQNFTDFLVLFLTVLHHVWILF